MTGDVFNQIIFYPECPELLYLGLLTEEPASPTKFKEVKGKGYKRKLFKIKRHGQFSKKDYSKRDLKDPKKIARMVKNRILDIGYSKLENKN